MTESPRPKRKDAVANRQRLLDAANKLFAAEGLGVTLNDIAHHAGLGVGTAYRHFPNKEAVIDALLEERLEAIEQLAHEMLEEPDAWQAIIDYLERILKMRQNDRGLDQIMNDPTLGETRVNDVRLRLAPLVVQLVDRAKDSGELRDDFAPTDIAFIQTALSAVMDSTRGLAPEHYRRYLTLILDGMRADGRSLTPQPVAPLTSQQTHAAMTSGRRRRRRR